jgi:hypothetical protein
MSTAHETTTEISEMLALLRETPQGSLPLDDIDRLETIVRKIVREAPCWISEEEAAALLGATVPGSIAYLAKRGFLPSRRSDDGSLELSFASILYERMVREGLMAIGGEELTDEEKRILSESRPGTLPWKREGATPSA